MLRGNRATRRAMARKARSARSGVAFDDTDITDVRWTLDPTTIKGGEVLDREGQAKGWTKFMASSKNGNSTTDPSGYPAVAIGNTTFDFTKPDSYTALLWSPQDGSKNRFGFYLGYKNPNSGVFIGYDAGGWFWQRYGGDGAWYQGSRVGAPAANAYTKITISWDGTHAGLTVDGKKAFDPVDYSGMKPILTNKIAMKASGYGNDLTTVFIRDVLPRRTVTGTVVDTQGKPISNAIVRINAAGVDATTGADGTFSIPSIMEGSYTLTAGADGYSPSTKDITISGGDLSIGSIILQKTVDYATQTISSDDMDVDVNAKFPAVRRYTMKKLGNKIMEGQPEDTRVVSLNGKAITLHDNDVTMTKKNGHEADYALHVKDAANTIDADLTVALIVSKNELHMEITKIENNAGEDHPIQTVEFPGQSLISVDSSQSNAQFTGSRMSSDTNKPGDKTFDVTDSLSLPDAGDYTYGFVSGNGLSAGLWSNSEHDGTVVADGIAGGSANTRVVAATQPVGIRTSLGLSSAPWYYMRVVKDSKNRSYTVHQTDMPKAAVAITGDANKDGAINWEDGALAYRSIMNNPYKSSEVPDIVAYRIAMNFGGQAQNPFLTTLDNVKKVALNTDGLGQGVLLKGYANEGHDSGHPDYADIGKRIGGAADMNTLMKDGAKYGARFGIHVNADEMYPEAKAFSEDMARRNGNGNLRYGWNWLDQAVGIDGIYDLASSSRANRFQALKDEVGNNLDFVYVDVWGNETSGAEDSWETRKLSKMITDRGWRMANEWGAANEYDATFQHWATDLTYGGSTLKGENSQVMRFLRNQQKDSWDGDYPSYGGAANAPLLGGYSMKDFEGWQGRNDYDAYIKNLFGHDVSTKFLQHFTVDRWVNSPLDSTSVQDPKTNNGNEFIALSDKDGNRVTIARGSNDSSSAAYRDRTITLNGKVVASGAVTPGDGKGQGTESYLLPWLWDASTGKKVTTAKQKLYLWSDNGGTRQWELPKDWAGQSSVQIYRLTDLGKTDRKVVSVSGGKVSLTAAADTPYVIYRGDAKISQIPVIWSEGMHLKDVGFNAGQDTLRTNWRVAGNGTAKIVKEGFTNPVLNLNGKSSVSQTITDLKPGKNYAIYVGVDNRSDGKATMAVRDGGKSIGNNYTRRSIAQNYVKAYAHSNSNKGVSRFQNMYVYFTAPKSGTATLTLSHDSAGDAFFDDVRVVENVFTARRATRSVSDGMATDKNGLVSFTNGFENNAQGIWPFVVSGSEGVEDNRVHLSELHAPFTQAGWDVKKMDDVLDGSWSVKVNGIAAENNNALVYQTIPQNVRFEPGYDYRVSFSYQSGSDDIYSVVTGEGEYPNALKQVEALPKALGTTKTVTFTIRGGASGQTWFGIKTNPAAKIDTEGQGGAAANFGGYKDLVLDDLHIERVKPKDATRKEANKALDDLRTKWDPKKASLSKDLWAQYQNGLTNVEVLAQKDGATPSDYARAINLAERIDAYMQGGDDSAKNVIPTDADELEDAIKEASARKEEDYTPETWKTFADRLDEARAKAADTDATLADRLLALTNLRTAEEGLIASQKQPTNPTNPTDPAKPTKPAMPGQSGNKTAGKATKNSTRPARGGASLARTGAAVSMITALAVSLIAAGIALCRSRKASGAHRR